ncbi:tyrosine-type recombinase/integrase [Chitinimonas arctica]|uniref:Tyrosine-type recombinase/integrase n=2 Tax=Chitinimonas arctica TaxID=2594795 RepID=A0A516SM43_9NEIS|nr:tyrosine-type recombinase/integrase [Chitinimonas arctica]
MANLTSSILTDVFREAMSAGWINENFKAETILQQTRHNGPSLPGDSLHPDSISRGFADQRDELGLGVNPPTLHEIRSLAARLYAKAYSPAFAQLVLGHKSADMTAVYLDNRGSEWTVAEAPFRKSFE